MKSLVLFSCFLTAVIGIQSTCSPEARAVSASVSSPLSDSSLNMLTKEQLMGQFDPAVDSNFVRVEAPYTARAGMLLRREVYEAFKKMWQAARKENITLTIISSTRNFEQQKKIWEGKWERFAKETPDSEERALRILEYSSMPGTSRHHWGTDLDINDLNDASFVGKGEHRAVYEWMVKNASLFGFGQPYTEKGPARPYGYNEEKWHWSYLPLAKQYRAQYIKEVRDEDITGFKGAETAVLIGVVNKYVSGVSLYCQ